MHDGLLWAAIMAVASNHEHGGVRERAYPLVVLIRLLVTMLQLGMWWNWYTRTLQKRMPQGLGVRVSPCPQQNENCLWAVFRFSVGMGARCGASCMETRKPERDGARRGRAKTQQRFMCDRVSPCPLKVQKSVQRDLNRSSACTRSSGVLICIQSGSSMIATG